MAIHSLHTASRKNPPSEALQDPGEQIASIALHNIKVLDLAIAALADIAQKPSSSSLKATNALRAIQREMCG